MIIPESIPVEYEVKTTSKYFLKRDAERKVKNTEASTFYIPQLHYRTIGKMLLEVPVLI